MSKPKLRNAIAAEAARLILRGKESEYTEARKRAARWLSRRKVSAADMPSALEIQSELHALSGLFAGEHQKASLWAMREIAVELMQVLAAFQPRISGCAVDGPVLNGAEITLDVSADSASDVVDALKQSGHRARIDQSTNGQDEQGRRLARVRLNHGFPCLISVHLEPAQEDEVNSPDWHPGGLDLEGLRQLLAETAASPDADNGAESDAGGEHEYHPDTFACLELLLQRLKQVQLPPDAHPEGDALYHSLQTYELGLQERPYDEEFLLACLLHDAGLVIDRRHPVPALLGALGNLLTERTRFLIEHLAKATEFLRTGQMPRSLRRSEHFDDLLLLARCDRDGRVPGTDVPELEEALEYIGSLESAWDDV